MPEGKPSVKIVNIVASAALNQTISLKQIVQKFPHAE
jgi:TATA-box binding protein (TBP) (component of TFIID and TFIIIB)